MSHKTEAEFWARACEAVDIDTDATGGEWQTAFDKTIADYHARGYEAGRTDAATDISATLDRLATAQERANEQASHQVFPRRVGSSRERGSMIDIERIAHVCHEANRALQVTGGEEPSPHFFDAPEWQVQSAYEGVSAAIEGVTPEQLHESWCAAKVRDGWIYGDVKDAEARTHPCLVAYDQLPADQRLKDRVFQAVVQAFTDHEQEATR